MGVGVDAVSKTDALTKLLGFLGEDRLHTLFTPNPEFILEAQNDREFAEVLNKGDLVVPDGIGVVLASRLTDVKIKERVAGCDLIMALFNAIKDTDESVYLFGGKPGVAELAKENMQKKYPGLKIAGCSDGYFDVKKERLIIHEIQRLRPAVLLVGIGFPNQEKWIYRHRHRLPVRIAAGIGGSIDVMAGTAARAPAFMRKIGLEWFWRLLRQPSRIKRMYKLPWFLIKAVIARFSNYANVTKP